MLLILYVLYSLFFATPKSKRVLMGSKVGGEVHGEGQRKRKRASRRVLVIHFFGVYAPLLSTPPLFYCKPVNDNGGPCHASDCDHRSSCMLQMKRQQHPKDGKTVTHLAHANCTLFCAPNAQKRTGSQQGKKTIFLDVS